MKKKTFISAPVILKPLQVEVTYSFEEAFKKFKSLVQKERIVGQVKAKMQYEKPSVKKRRKRREAEARRFLQDRLEKMIESGEWDRRKRQKEKKKAEKLEKKLRRQAEFELG